MIYDASDHLLCSENKHRCQRFPMLVGSCKCGPGHAMKNVAGQLISPLRTITFGRFQADTSGSRRLCMPPSAYVRDDRQSDHLVALMFNPYFLITDPDTISVHYVTFYIFSYHISFIVYKCSQWFCVV